jgi:asparagine N-glycosylation enzyme membrane subunit Stt3
MGKTSGLDVFRNFLDQYRRLIVVAVGASAVPLAAALASLTPAWPRGIAGVTAVAQLLVLALVFQFLQSARRSTVSRIIVRSTVMLCLLLPVYFFLLSLFTYTEPASNERFTKGYECTANARIVFENSCPFLGHDDLKKAEYDEERLWTVQSVSVVKSLILTVWLACFAALSTALGSFAVFQMSRKHT